MISNKLKLLIFINDAKEYQDSITLYFDKGGIEFNTTFSAQELKELENNIIKYADEDLYISKYNSFIKNYETAKEVQ